MTAAPPRSAPLAIPMFFVVRAQFIPESARFNVSTGNTQAALATLQHIARMNRSALPEGRLVEPVLVSPGGRSSPPRPPPGATRESPSSREARGTRVTTLRTKLLHQLFPLSCLFFLL